MKKKKRKTSLRLFFILLALVFAVGGLVSIIKVASNSTESRSKAAEIVSIIKPSWEFNENGNNEGWDAGNFGFTVTGGMLTGTTLGKIIPLNARSKTSIANIESYLANNNINKGLPYGLKGINVRIAVSVPDKGYIAGNADQSVSSDSLNISQDKSGKGKIRRSKLNCTECRFGKLCPLISKIPGFCPAPSPVPIPPCTPPPPPCEGPRCPKFPTVIPPGGWCPPQAPRVFKFRVEHNALNMLPQVTPGVADGNFMPPAKPVAKPLYFDVIADGQMREYQVQFPRIDKFDLKNLKFVFAGAPKDSKISIDYIRLVSLIEIKPSISPIAKNPVSWKTNYASLFADNFFITVDGKTFFGIPDPNTTVNINSDPGGREYTTLEVIWREQGTEMRVFMYFRADSYQWWPFEIRTYNGKTPGDWIYYTNLKGIGGILGEKYIAPTLDLVGTDGPMKGVLHFDNLILQAFTNSYYPTLTPTSMLTPTPTQPIFCKVEVYQANSSTKPPYIYTYPIDANAMRVKPGDYFLYAMRIFNNTNKNLGGFTATAQQLQGRAAPLEIVNTDANCSVDSNKLITCGVPNALGPYGSALTSASFVGKVLDPNVDGNKFTSLSTLYDARTDLGRANCTSFQWFAN